MSASTIGVLKDLSAGNELNRIGVSWLQPWAFDPTLPESPLMPSLLPQLYHERSNAWQFRKILAQADAEAVVDALEALGKDPTVNLDVVSYTMGISACGRSTMAHRGYELFETMLAAKVQADVPSFNAAISSCEKAGGWRQAFGLCLCWTSPFPWVLRLGSKIF